MSTQKFNTAELDLRPRISVIGIGGAGGNAVNNMIRAKLEGVEFVVANTDAQSIEQSLVLPERRLQLGLHITQGLGAGSKPDVGRASAEESLEEVLHHLKGNNMVFITAGMGGGTGTGAAPVIARAVRESGILTVGVVTKPFHFEGSHRMRVAEKGIEELQQYVDTLIIIPNQNLFRVANEHTTFDQAFEIADNVLCSGVRNVTDLMMRPGLINLDFADIRTVMAEMGKAMMGTGEAEGDRRASEAAAKATDNPLLDDVSMKGAKGVLINITGGPDMTLYEVDEAANQVRENADPDANIIFGSTFDEKLIGRIRVSVVATGIGGVPGQSNWRQNSPSTEQMAGLPMTGLPLGTRPSSPLETSNFTNPGSHSLGSNSLGSPPNSSLGANSGVSPAVSPYELNPTSLKPAAAESFEGEALSPKVSSPSENYSPPQPSLYGQQPRLSSSEPPVKGEKKRFFDRFITTARQNQTTTVDEKHPPQSQPREEDKDHEVREIPAFLRRGN